MKFLGRAKQFLRDLASEPDSKVQPFNVTCAAGHRVRGDRTEGYQALRCPACGEGVFVLPRSPLPDPIAPPRSRTSKSSRPEREWVEEGPVELSDQAILTVEYAYDGAEPSVADAEIIWDDAPADPNVHRAVAAPEGKKQQGEIKGKPADPGPRPETEPSTRRRARPKTTDPAAPAPARVPNLNGNAAPADRDRPGRSGKPAAVQPAAALLEPQARARKSVPRTAIFWLVPVLVAATIGWRYWQQKRLDYPLVAERGRTEGIPALDEGRFDRANFLLSAAKIAVDSLGGAVDDADAIRHAADEAAIFVDLCPRTLEEMLEEAGRDPAAWSARFDNLYKHRAIVVDSRIETMAVPGQSTGYDVEYRIFPVGGAVQFGDSRDIRPERIGLIDFKSFELFDLARPERGERVVFGARLASFQLDPDRDRWVIGLEPRSGVFIEHTKALESLGWPAAAPIDREPESKP